jgi:hypothetical protein
MSPVTRVVTEEPKRNILFFKKLDKVVELVGGGSVINGA